MWRVAAHRHARVARLGNRAAQDYRSARQSHRIRCERIGRFPSGDSVNAGLWVLRQASRYRLGPRPHRTCLGSPDEAPGIHAVCVPGRRLGRSGHERDGATGTPRSCSAFTSTSLARFRATWPGRSSPATRRHPVSQPTKDAPTSSWPPCMRGDAPTPASWGRGRKRCTDWRTHPSAWPPGFLTTVTAGASRRHYQAPRSWTEQAYHNLIYFNEAGQGGHFAAWEQPQLFSEEVRAGLRPLRK
jgi:hypothetical protein